MLRLTRKTVRLRRILAGSIRTDTERPTRELAALETLGALLRRWCGRLGAAAREERRDHEERHTKEERSLFPPSCRQNSTTCTKNGEGVMS